MKQWITYIVAALLVLAILLHFRPVQEFSPTGITLPISAPAKVQTSVSKIALLPPWFHGTVKKMAYINLELHAPTQSKQAENNIILAARQRASKYGANAILVQGIGYQPPGPEGTMLAMYVFHGIAVKVKGVHL